MRDAVDAFLEVKWSQYGSDIPKAYKAPDSIVTHIHRPDDETIELVKDYCQYVHDTYGRFPAYMKPMYQRLTCQAQHVDLDFYEEHYPPGAVTGQHQGHFHRWHPEITRARAAASTGPNPPSQRRLDNAVRGNAWDTGAVRSDGRTPPALPVERRTT